MKLNYKFSVIGLLFLALTSCFSDIDDDPISDTEIKDFIWKGLNLWYFWQGTDSAPDLADNRFSNDTDYINFLNSFDSPNQLFYSLLSDEDRFSWIVDDYFALSGSLSGVSKNNGMAFGLGLIDNGPNVFGYVQYVLPNSSASENNVIRGDIFLTVNSSQLTADNYLSLISSDVYTIGLAELDNNDNLILTGEEITLTKQIYQENPIYISNTFEVNGIKVGYLMYNRFLSDYDQQLNQVFANFVAEGVEQLVLDLRYNPGGSVNSAINLGSMITGNTTNDVYLKQIWNNKIQSTFTDEDVTRYFAQTLSNGNSINSLNLNKVYILAQNSSASASELVINALEPYIDVIHIGDVTRGKNEFSITLYDNPDCAFLPPNTDCNGSINPNHTWAMQPLVGRNENADGFSDYTNGLTPDISLDESLSNLGVLGQQDEPLLARAIQHLTGNGRTGETFTEHKIKIFDYSNKHTPTGTNMYLEPDDVPML
ncbi:C-terminal processing protease CtpA/Prc [Mesoflavibacter sabulilitoris]|uniref:Carboxyl-terminal protease n=1 Tax=Mesoflavibacter zeaxanthinifaciens subsp. sabulilitoris TaxID=1520893 RepID=A0A2T1NKK6_9FLAO|nr:S41 family peptidase [Mesoflavibacter zeaxanthinifaciens]MBB3122608.1 C-terminal processing protease CtpA/Prc [Mesoflavibacter zeaxanthinifaciens subsp. sabulilitoris]PSG93437.1 carboxyl-terminal protease [Mesoflavibacter zeaxanthinifaciens subsp. sabulilitoris]